MSRSVDAPRQARHWRKTRLLTAALLGVWALSSFGVIAYARDLAGIRFFGWPLAYYMGAQGSLILFLLIIGCYCLVMNRLDREAYQHGDVPFQEDSQVVQAPAAKPGAPAPGGLREGDTGDGR